MLSAGTMPTKLAMLREHHFWPKTSQKTVKFDHILKKHHSKPKNEMVDFKCMVHFIFGVDTVTS